MVKFTCKSYDYPLIELARTENGGFLYSSFCPGKGKRDLSKDLRVISDRKIDIIVCLLEWQEMRKMSLLDYPQKAQKSGLILYHLPIRDTKIPKISELDAIVPFLVEKISEGCRILIHCRYGRGRSLMIASCFLIHFGFDYLTVVETLKNVHREINLTSVQKDFIQDYWCILNEQLSCT